MAVPSDVRSNCMGRYEDADDVKDYDLDQSHFDEAYQTCYLGRTLEAENSD